MSNLIGLPTLLQVNACLSTSMKICTFKVSRSGSLLTTVHMTDQKTIESCKDPIQLLTVQLLVVVACSRKSVGKYFGIAHVQW